ncbi:hypothetical protein JCGZ_16310 [Jatropha curcas]|uniref:UBP-type domain-containing protein n=1 Tax=Jatropha curcas TaxID=180498 RepID=A0A067L7T1_JATCU|nr:hypothetical protein JCGZ_16310 [Jatropha curcas]
MTTLQESDDVEQLQNAKVELSLKSEVLIGTSKTLAFNLARVGYTNVERVDAIPWPDPVEVCTCRYGTQDDAVPNLLELPQLNIISEIVSMANEASGSSSSLPLKRGFEEEDEFMILGSESGWVEARTSCDHLGSLSSDLSHIPTPDTSCYSDLSVWCFACDAYLDAQVIVQLRTVYETAYILKFGEAPPFRTVEYSQDSKSSNN